MSDLQSKIELARKFFKGPVGIALLCALGFVIVISQSSSWLAVPATVETSTTEPTGTQEETPPVGIESDEELPVAYDPNAPLFAQSEAEDTRPLWMVSLDLTLKLALVIGLAYAALLGLRRLQGGAGSPLTTGGSAVRVVETVGLAPGRSLHVITIGDRTLLIGATDHQVSLLTEVEDPTVGTVEELSEFGSALSAAEAVGVEGPEWQQSIETLRASMRRMRGITGTRNNGFEV